MPACQQITDATAIAANSRSDESSRRERREFISGSLEKAICQLNHPFYAPRKDRLR
eukprot:CAMPEP_0201240020 /NCGR_PEP_ID=MMETSP0852-20130820/27637_1 /ASSEMBLY_ACC=CAM_ASM_000632 /TAXON_ID=183588 /ORGANISM="Pseudo-nitzschia fraudulenta, Strain WWA7" /LENGTH=55 /DNA_ID=CAMNT_0047535665 /DNA_START=36 /DNA_END=200 /DNA_ORIENTATION=+